MNLNCPHCGEKLPIWKKIIISPRFSMKCDECGGYFTFPYYFTIGSAIICLAIMYFVLEVLKKDWSYATYILLVLAVVINLIFIMFVPVVKR